MKGSSKNPLRIWFCWSVITAFRVCLGHKISPEKRACVTYKRVFPAKSVLPATLDVRTVRAGWSWSNPAFRRYP